MEQIHIAGRKGERGSKGRTGTKGVDGTVTGVKGSRGIDGSDGRRGKYSHLALKQGICLFHAYHANKNDISNHWYLNLLDR